MSFRDPAISGLSFVMASTLVSSVSMSLGIGRPDSLQTSSAWLRLLSGLGPTLRNAFTRVIFSNSLFSSSSGRLSRAGSRPKRANAASRLAKFQSTSFRSTEDDGESGRVIAGVAALSSCASAADMLMLRFDLAIARSRCLRTSSGLLNRKT